MRRRPGIQGLQSGAAARVRELEKELACVVGRARAERPPRSRTPTPSSFLQTQFAALGASVSETAAEHVRAQLAEFKAKLEAFALAHRADVRADPRFRAQFHAMCATVGVDPLASSKSAWASLLGIGDYYAELGVAVVEACLATRAVDGGLTDLDAVVAYVTKRRGPATAPATADDVARAVAALGALGSGFSIERVGAARVVRSVPGALTNDAGAVLEFAAGVGWTSRARLVQGLGWGAPRADAALAALAADGVALVDDGAKDGVRRHFFPCLTPGLDGWAQV